jgi:ComF family protein
LFKLVCFRKSGKVQRLLHAIKYQQQKELAEYLGKIYAEDLLKESILFDVVLPIPLHKNKLKLRGFNQSEWFAKGLANQMNSVLDNTSLIRTKQTSTQTRKRKFERWENVEGIFNLETADLLKNKKVLLVDDVITTGATIEAAWQALKDVEGIELSVGAIAYAKR